MNTAKEIAYHAWTSAANAYRLYPDNKHTFADYWTAIGKDVAEIVEVEADAAPDVKQDFFNYGYTEQKYDECRKENQELKELITQLKQLNVGADAAPDVETWYRQWMKDHNKSGVVVTVNVLDMLKDFAATSKNNKP